MHLIAGNQGHVAAMKILSIAAGQGHTGAVQPNHGVEAERWNYAALRRGWAGPSRGAMSCFLEIKGRCQLKGQRREHSSLTSQLI